MFLGSLTNTARKMSKCAVFSGLFFPTFGLNTEIYGVNLRIQPKAGKHVFTVFWTPLKQSNFSIKTLHKLPKFHLISWRGAIRPKLCGNWAFAQNFYTRKLGEITLFYAVQDSAKQLQVAATVDLTSCNCFKFLLC